MSASQGAAAASSRYRLRRLRNALRRVAAGLGLRGECVWEGVRNDLFVAHASIYHFFARHVPGKRVIDAGCGTGYGGLILARAGAGSVIGLDVDARSVRHARRRYRHPALRFRVGDCEELAAAPGSAEVIVSSNVLEHLRRPASFLTRAAEVLTPGGRLLLVIPAITNEFLLRENQAIPFHVSNLYVDGWLELFSRHGWRVSLFRHVHAAGNEVLDFSSPFPSVHSVDEFDFIPASRDDLYTLPTLGGVYELTAPALSRPPTPAPPGRG